MFFFIFLLLTGFSISLYLLWSHFELTIFQTSGPDICSAVFGASCDRALASRFSEIAGIPLGGWGMIYYTALVVLLLLAILFGPDFKSYASLLTLGLILAGALVSISLLTTFLLNPALFCPLCTTIHIINLLLIYPAWMNARPSWNKVRKGLADAGRFLFLGKAEQLMQARWHTLAFVLVILVGLAVFQWVRIQQSAFRGAAANSFFPERILEEFLAKEVQAFRPGQNVTMARHKEAPIELVVFSDFQCSACREFSRTVGGLFEKFGDKINLSFKHFPLSQTCNPAISADVHPNACAAARAAQAAAHQGKFWIYHNLLFQTDLAGADETTFFSLARQAGLEEKQFRQDFFSDSVMEEIKADVEEGNRLQLSGTPAVFLNGRPVGDRSAKSLNLLLSFYYFQNH